MIVLVTGAAGFIGSHLAESLRDEGHDVIGVDRRAIAVEGIQAIHADLNYEAHALPDVDVVFHLAGRPGVHDSWSDFDDYLRQNLRVTWLLLQRYTHVEKFAYASSSSIYGSGEGPVSPYGVTKLAVENLVAAYDVPSIALRYFTVYGPRQRPDMAFHRFIDAAANARALHIYGSGEQRRHFTYVSDAVTATKTAALHYNGSVDIAGRHLHSVNEAVGTIAEHIGPLGVKTCDPKRGDPHVIYPKPFATLWGGTSLQDGLEQQIKWQLQRES